MTSRRSRTRRSLAVQAAELALAVPQVVAHRMTRMALAGPTPSARDRKEFARMVSEKNTAFAASWTAMGLHAAQANQAQAASFVRSFFAAAQGSRPSAIASALAMQHAAVDMLAKGLAPVHKKAVANAKRLGKTKLR